METVHKREIGSANMKIFLFDKTSTKNVSKYILLYKIDCIGIEKTLICLLMLLLHQICLYRCLNLS